MEGNLVLLRKADVPEYLRDSEFFSSLCDDDGHGDYFEVPEFCYRSSTLVRSQEDLDHLLSTLRYWCVSKPVDFLLPMLLKGLDFEISNIVSKFGNELTSIIELVEIGQQPTFGEKVALTIEFGDLSILKTLLGLATEDSDHKRTPALPLANRTNRAGHTQRCFVYTRLGIPLNEADDLDYLHWRNLACFQAAVCGHLDILIFLHEELHCPWNTETTSAAAYGGSLSCLQYAHEHGCPWSNLTCSNAAERGHLSCLKYAHEQGCPWGEDACYHAALNGHLSCLQYAHEQGCGWSYHTADGAARNGHLSCLRYLHELGCSWAFTCGYAAEFGHLDCLQYAHEHGCEWWGPLSCTAAASNGHLDCLRFAHEHGCPWNAKTTTEAAVYGNYACLKYCVEEGCQLTDAVMVVYEKHCKSALS